MSRVMSCGVLHVTSHAPSTCMESLALLNSFFVTVVTPESEGKGMVEGNEEGRFPVRYIKC